ncbi:MAG: hypothetical protein LBL43_04165 [Treponema sp.]|jgi:hypothetical protein|nr:hypothetical protein [Treponema sp.]
MIFRSPGGLVFLTLMLTLPAGLPAQEKPLEELLPAFRDKAVVFDIVARLVEQDRRVVWNSSDSRVTIPGRPVELQVVGDNIAVSVQFTPHFRKNRRHFLVAQGQIWIDIPGRGIRYQSTMQTIPFTFGEEIYFFPLGSPDSREEPRIEIQLTLRPYQEGSIQEAQSQKGGVEGNNAEQ